MKRALKYIVVAVLVGVGILVTMMVARVWVVERVPVDELLSDETTFFMMDDGSRVAYHVFENSSSTDVVVLVGGLGAWRESWRETIALERERGNTARFVVIDLPPFGLSNVPKKGSYSRVSQAERIANIIEQVASSSNKVTLLGHSYGGGPAAEVMFSRPDLVDQVVLVSPVINLGATTTNKVPAVLTMPILRTGLVAFGLILTPLQRIQLESFLAIKDKATFETLRVFTSPFKQPGSAGRLGEWLVAYVSDSLPLALSTNPENWVENQVPVTLVWGEADTLTPISDAYELQAVSPEITVIPLPGVGHIPMLEDTPVFHDALSSVW